MFSKLSFFVVWTIIVSRSSVTHAEVILRGQQQKSNGLSGRHMRRQLMAAMEDNTSPTPAPPPMCTIGGKSKQCGANGKAADLCCDGYECVSSWCKKATEGYAATSCLDPDDTTTSCYSPLSCQQDCDGNPTGICSSQATAPQSCSDDNAVIQTCDAWCKSDTILDAMYYEEYGFEGGFFSFRDEFDNYCSNNCGAEGGCCDHGITPIPVQRCESWSVSGNTNICEHGTSVNTLCRPGENDCANLSSKYVLTGIRGVDSNGLCQCFIDYTEDGIAKDIEVYNSACALNFECGCGIPYCPPP